MFKFFFRKRFVCGHISRVTWGGEFMCFSHKWRRSFHTKKEALVWRYYSEYTSVLYDRKTKITVVEPHRKVREYLRLLEENK